MESDSSCNPENLSMHRKNVFLIKITDGDINIKHIAKEIDVDSKKIIQFTNNKTLYEQYLANISQVSPRTNFSPRHDERKRQEIKGMEFNADKHLIEGNKNIVAFPFMLIPPTGESTYYNVHRMETEILVGADGIKEHLQKYPQTSLLIVFV